jgi:predicted Rossmann fold flavoprotein
MLLKECDLGGVIVKSRATVERVDVAQGSQGSNTYSVAATLPDEQLRLTCRSLVVATGALSIPTLGGSGFGYELASQFSMPLQERRAGLVPFMFSDAMKSVCERLSGLAVEVEIACGSQSFHENILFTHRGISGPAALQISNYWTPGEELNINLLPGRDAVAWMSQQKRDYGKSLLKNRLHQLLAKPLVVELQALWWPELAEVPLAECGDQRLQEIGQQLSRWCIKPSATEGYRTAEVTLGGVDTEAISSKTMEARHQQGLFFIGEVVDVSGHLGGFNFQWAWSSGYVAGMNC